MWQTLNEIDKIFKDHNYDTNNIIANLLEKFKLKNAFNKYGFKKDQGFSVIEIFFVLLYLPLLGATSINKFYRKHFENIATMQKDVLYRFINNSNIDWRRILLDVAKQFDRLTKNKEVSNKAALIIDDTALLKTGSCIEKISYVFDHVLRKSFLGFKNVACAHFDGTSYKVVDFSLHSERELKGKDKKRQFRSNVDKSTPVFGRLKETGLTKIIVAIEMMKRAAKNGFKFKYVLADSWYTSKDFILAIRQLHKKTVHAICAVKKDNRHYIYFGKSVNANQLLSELKKEGSPKRNRQNKVFYYETIVNYEGVGHVRLYFAKGRHQRHWKLFLSTDTSLTFNKFVELYSIRWGIEVIFKECKGYLKLGKCQARTFASQIADIAICYILYNMLVYSKRAGDYSTVGALFENLVDELREKTVAEKIWNMVKELLEVFLRDISLEYVYIDNFEDLLKTQAFRYIEENFENSFITPFLKNA